MRDYPQNLVPVNHVEPAPRRVRAVLAGRTVVDTTAPATSGSTPTTRSTTSLWPTWRPTRSSTRAPAKRLPGATCGTSAWRETASTAHAARFSPRRRSRASTTPSASSGPPWTPGSKRTSGSSSIHATPTRGSTRCARPGASASSPRASCWPSPPRPSCCSKRASRPGTTWTRPMSTSPTWCRRRRSPPAPTRAPRATTGRRARRPGPSGHRLVLPLPSPRAAPIAGLIAFYNEKVDLFLDGVKLERPQTHLS